MVMTSNQLTPMDQSSDLFPNYDLTSQESGSSYANLVGKSIISSDVAPCNPSDENSQAQTISPSETSVLTDETNIDHYVTAIDPDDFVSADIPQCDPIIESSNDDIRPLPEEPCLDNAIHEVVQQAYNDSIRVPQETRVIDWNHEPKMVAFCETEFSHSPNNYLRGCKWAPDSSCLLTNSNDNFLRIFNFPQQYFDPDNRTPLEQEMEPVVKIHEHELIYDYCWYPLMNSNDPVSCCIASCSRSNPVNLWDAFTGQKRATYRPFNHLDELEAPNSLSFSIDGCKLYCGFHKCIRIFDVERPGKQCEVRPKLGKKSPQRGIISCIAMHPTKRHVYACGSYNRTIGLYSEPGSLMTLLRGQQGGVTHLAFSPDGVLLASGGRKDPEILIWDVRQPGRILMTLIRNVGTNQRIYFEFDDSGQYLLSGSHSGQLFCYKIEASSSSDEAIYCPSFGWSAHRDVCNGVSINRWAGDIVATCSGQRHMEQPYLDVSDSSDDDIDMESNTADSPQQNKLSFWSFQTKMEVV